MQFDPVYMLFLAPAMLLSVWASAKTQGAFRKYSKVRTATGMTGREGAALMLERGGVNDVKIMPIKGSLTDHYNPVNKTLRLSQPVYNQPTIAAVGVGCHEAGHALQDATNYGPLKIRSLLAKPAGFGSKLGFYAMMAGLAMQSTGLFQLGVVLFCLFVGFSLITLPVEFDASNRAKKLAVEYGIVSEKEREGVDKVLDAAALTYVAAAASSVLQLLYFISRSRKSSSNQA